MHRTTAAHCQPSWHSPTDPHRTAHNLTQAHTCESFLMIHLNQAVPWSIHKRTAAPHATHAFLCTYLSKDRAKSQPSSRHRRSALSSRHANDDTKQLQDSKQMHVCSLRYLENFQLLYFAS